MKRGNNRFALYRTKDDPEGRRIRGQPYRELGPDRENINMDHYHRIYMGEYEERQSLTELMVQVKLLTKDVLPEPAGTGDVLQVNRDGEPVCYYIDGDRLKLITKFIRPSSGGTAFDDATKGFAIEGKTGSWDVADSMILDGKIFYLMENRKYKDTAGKAIVDTEGKLILDNVAKGFDAGTKQQIRDQIRKPHVPPFRKEFSGLAGQDRDLLIWQRPYENGTWERRSESGTEANYDMVDGRVNNSVSIHPSVESTQTKNQEKPKNRKSVILKLRKKQRELALKAGKPIPTYLQEERDRK